MTIKVCRFTRRRELTRLHFTSKWKGPYSLKAFLFTVIIKTTIPLIMIGFKNSCFPLILLTSCYQTVCYRTVQEANHIQSCSLNQLNQFFFRSYFQLLVSLVPLAARISQIRFFSANIWISYIKNHYSSLGWYIWTQHIIQLPVGLLAQLVERCTGIAEVVGSNPVRTWIFFFRSYFQLLVSVVLLVARISQIRFFTAVQIYEFRISKIIIHHLDNIFRPNISTSSLLAC